MSRRYKATGYVPVPDVNLGDVFEADFTEAEENDFVRNGQVELQEEEYRVTGPQPIFGHPSGERFAAALSLAQETTLAAAGHIERAKPKAASKQKKEG